MFRLGRTNYQLQEEGLAPDERTELVRKSQRSAPTGVKRKLRILWCGRFLCASLQGCQATGELHTGPGHRSVEPLSTLAAVPPGQLHKGPEQRSWKVHTFTMAYSYSSLAAPLLVGCGWGTGRLDLFSPGSQRRVAIPPNLEALK